MLHAPIDKKKTKDNISKRQSEPDALGRDRSSGWAGYSSLSLGGENRSVLAKQGNDRSQGWQPMSLSSLSQGGVLQRKCACGNSAGSAGICEKCQGKEGGILQTKLSIGSPDDKYEQEADRVADRVMSASPNSVVNSAPPQIQRFTGQTTGQADLVAPASVDRVLSNPGSPLESGLQQDMGQRFGHDFSRVRVHTDTAAARSAQEVSAKAYTVKNNIVFGSGQFAPEIHKGRHLLAHELTHVVQQSKGNFVIQRQDYETDSSSEQLDDKSKKVCGPDITKQLKDAQLKTRKQFAGWNNSRKESACGDLVSIIFGPIAWDIIQLNENDWILAKYGSVCASEDASPSCINSVKVDGNCFYAGSVNYAHFGNMFDLCQEYYASAYPLNNQFSETEMIKWINLYKGPGIFSSGSPNFRPSVNWALAGFYNWPHGAFTPSGDRPNCSPTCTLPYVGGDFDVNWSGETF